MKKLWCVAFIFMFLLVGCSENSVQESTSNSDTSNSVPTTEETEQVFYEDDILKATFVSVSEQAGLDGVGYIGVKFENKSDSEITVLAMDSSVNDTMVMYFSGVPATMQGGKKLNYAWGFYFDKVGITDISEVEKLEFSLEIDDENMHQLVRTDIITIEVNSKE